MAEVNQVTCPHCSQPYAVRPEQWAQYHGRTIHCTKCGRPFVVTAPPEALSSIPQPSQGMPAPSQYPTSDPQAPGGAPVAVPPPYPPAPGYPAQGIPYNAPYPPPYGYGAYPPMRYPGPPTSGWATASLVTGLLGFCVPVIPSVFAIWMGIMGLNKTRNGRAAGRGMAVAGLVLGAVTLLLGGLILAAAVPAALSRAREEASRVKCESSLRQISSALMMYANSHEKHFPDSLEDLVRADPGLSPKLFVCPSSGKTPATPATFAAGIASGRHCSYIYVGKGLDSDAPSNTLLMYEPLSNHQRTGMNVLFVDGRVEFLNRDDAQSVVEQRAAGMTTIRVNPGGNVSSPATSQE